MEKASWFILAITAVAMLIFEICGFCGYMEVAKWTFLIAGILAWIFLIMRGILWLRRRNSYLG